MARVRFEGVRISGIQLVVPEGCINIDDEIEFFNNDETLLKRNKTILGLGTRHVADDRTTNCDLCESAGRHLLQNLGVTPNSIGALIVASTSHDYKYPASACILQDRLGLTEDATCVDMTGLACSSYVHALLTAHSYVQSGVAEKCLVLAGEISSIHSDRRNRNSNMLFGDAGTATLVEKTQDDRGAWFLTGTRGRGWDKIIAPAGGWAIPIQKDIIDIEETDSAGNVWHLRDEIMKGMDIFRFTTDVGPKGIAGILQYSGRSKEDVDYFAFHQANKQIVRTVASYANLPKEKFSTEAFTRFGNCGTAAVVTDICQGLSDRTAKNVCLATFGVGLSWGFAMLDMSDVIICPVSYYKTPAGKMNRREKIEYWIKYFKEGNR